MIRRSRIFPRSKTYKLINKYSMLIDLRGMVCMPDSMLKPVKTRG